MVCGNDDGFVVCVWYVVMMVGLRPNDGGACGTCVVCGNDGGFVACVWYVVMMVGLWYL